MKKQVWNDFKFKLELNFNCSYEKKSVNQLRISVHHHYNF